MPRWAESVGKDSLFIRYKNAKFTEIILEETKKNILRRGGPNKLFIVKSTGPKFVGKNVLEISKMLNILPEVAVFEILKTGYIRVAPFKMDADDIHTFMKHDWVVTGSDVNSGHLKKYGSFPRKYHKYVQQEKVIAMASFINGSTSKTAAIFKIKNRGKLQVGYFADIIIFNPKTFKDIADYTDVFHFSEGLIYSIINGNIAVDAIIGVLATAGTVSSKGYQNTIIKFKDEMEFKGNI